MAPGGRRRQTLGHGLDKEVYQVVRKIVDERTQYGDSDLRLTFVTIYDEIKRSNSSLNRKPKKILEESVERVLDTIQQDGRSSDSEADAPLNEVPTPALKSSNGMNKSIVGAWATTIPKATSKAETDHIDSPQKPTMTDSEPTSKRRLANGEPPNKKRKAASAMSSSTTIDKSPPSHVTLADLGGVDHIIQHFEDLLVIPMIQPEIYTITKVKPPRGILIHGPPGCGKTMIANAFAAELGVSFISISAPSIVSGMSGESEKALRDHFEEAKKSAPCLIFIDEIDAITPKRESAQREMEKRIVAQLLTCMDDLALEKTDGKTVIVLAATNRPDSLDPALRRGGRFDKEINMPVPSEPVREQILKALTRELSLPSDFDYASLARRTPGFVGADLSDLVSTAGAIAIKRYATLLKANAAASSMELDDTVPIEPQISSPATPSPLLSSVRRLIKYAKETSPDHFITTTQNDLTTPNITTTTITTQPSTQPIPQPPISITYADFLTALPQIQPSAMREGFATIPSTTFSSIGALQTHISELTATIISPILNPGLYSSLGITPSSGALLWGPPGCGKTLLAKACANSSHANFISVKGPELLNKYVGESERAVRQVFTRARSSVPVIIFFDELDALVPRRDGSMSEASSRVVNTLLTELDGVGNSREGIYVVAATNRPDIIDPAMLRPGRLDTKLFVGLPDEEGRVDILRTLCRKVSGFVFTDEVADIARKCIGFSGADLEYLLQRAGYAAVNRVRTALAGGTVEGTVGPVTLTVDDFIFARLEVRRSVSEEDMEKFNLLQRQWGKTR